MAAQKWVEMKKTDVINASDVGRQFEHIVYIGTVPYAAQHPREYTVRVDGKEYVHTSTNDDGTWIYSERV